VRETRDFDRINRTRPIVWRGVNMNIDGTGEKSRSVRIGLWRAATRGYAKERNRNSCGKKNTENGREKSPR